MARYIDADAFKRKLADKDIFFPALYENELNETPIADVVSTKAFEQVKWERDTAIEQLEAYGVGFCENKELVEVNHGYWIDNIQKFTSPAGVTKDYLVGYKCSVCGRTENRKEPYCNCGAKMDGGKALAKITTTTNSQL